MTYYPDDTYGTPRDMEYLEAIKSNLEAYENMVPYDVPFDLSDDFEG